jgi:hypothetical protein
LLSALSGETAEAMGVECRYPASRQRGSTGFTKSNMMAPALYPNALYCDCGKCSAVEDTMLNESKGALALVVDKYDPKGVDTFEYAGRGLSIPDDDTEPPAKGSYEGTYTYNKSDGSWTGSGTGTETFNGGDTTNYTWEERSNRKEQTYKYTGGTGKYKDASGGGTYELHGGYEGDSGGYGDYKPGTLQVCKYKDQIVLP